MIIYICKWKYEEICFYNSKRSYYDNSRSAIKFAYIAKAMALKLGISTAAYTKIERGITGITLERLICVSEILHCTIFDLLEVVFIDYESILQLPHL